MTLTLSHHTKKDGEPSWTVLLDGQPLMASTKDEQDAREMLRFQHAATIARRQPCRVTDWNGDTGEETLLDHVS